MIYDDLQRVVDRQGNQMLVTNERLEKIMLDVSVLDRRLKLLEDMLTGEQITVEDAARRVL